MEVTPDLKFLVTLEISPHQGPIRPNNVIRFWNIENYQLTYVIPTNAVSFNLIGNILISNSKSGLSARRLYTFDKLWNIPLDNPTIRLPMNLNLEPNYFFVTIESNDDLEDLAQNSSEYKRNIKPDLIRIGLEDGRFQGLFYGNGPNKENKPRKRKKVQYSDIWISEDKKLLHCCIERHAYTWDIESRKIKDKVVIPFSHRYTTNDIDSDAHPYISPWKFSPPKIIDYSKVNDIRVRHKKRGREDNFYFTKDKQFLFLCIDRKIEIWDLFEKNELISFGDCWDFYVCEQLGLVFTTFKGIIDVWDLEKTKLIQKIDRNENAIGRFISDAWGMYGYVGWDITISEDLKYLKMEKNTITETEMSIIYEISTGSIIKEIESSVDWAKTEYSGKTYVIKDLTCYVLGEVVILEFPENTTNVNLQKFLNLPHQWSFTKNAVFVRN